MQSLPEECMKLDKDMYINLKVNINEDLVQRTVAHPRIVLTNLLTIGITIVNLPLLIG